MPFIYKPIRQFMIPNEATINPKDETKFSLKIGGQICIAYRFFIYDLQNRLVSGISTNRAPTTKRYDIIDVNLLQNVLTIASNDLKNGDKIRFLTNGTLPKPLAINTDYYIGNFQYGRFAVFSSKSDAEANRNRIDIIDDGDGAHSIFIETPLYNGDTLEIFLDKNKLAAGNTYKWQVELFANDLSVTSVSTANDTFTIPNHNFVTGDMIFVSGSSIPSPLKAYTQYFIHKIDANTIALFDNIEGARNDAGRIDITSSGSSVKVSNIAVSEQIPFLSYDNPVVEFKSETITQQSFTFKPKYTHPQDVMISSFTAYIRSETNPEVITSSGLIENIKLEYTFDGLLNGEVYDVKFVINTKVNQTYSTLWTQFQVKYETPDLGLAPEVINNPETASVTMRWSGIKQIIGDPVGEFEFIDDFVKEGNVGLKIESNASLIFSKLDIKVGSSPPSFWWTPLRDDFTGLIMRCDNKLTGEYMEIGYNGFNFYRIINGILINNAPMQISHDFLYMIGIAGEQLITNVVKSI